MTEDDRNQLGWGKAFSDQFMNEIGLVTSQSLQEVRYRLLIVFPIKNVEVACDLNRYKMEWTITFKFMGTLFRSKRKLIGRILNILQDQFPEYEIMIRENE